MMNGERWLWMVNGEWLISKSIYIILVIYDTCIYQHFVSEMLPGEPEFLIRTGQSDRRYFLNFYEYNHNDK